MVDAFHETASVEAAAGSTPTTRDNPLPEGGLLQHVSVGVDAGNPPIRVAVYMNLGGTFNHTLITGWVRGLSDPSRGGDLWWHGTMCIPPNARLFLRVANNSGSTVTVSMFYLGEKPAVAVEVEE